MRSIQWRRVARISGICLARTRPRSGSSAATSWSCGRTSITRSTSDAIVVLGPPDDNGRIDTALALIDKHIASNLVISVGSPEQFHAKHLCTTPQQGFSVTCFEPDPATTRGEAEEVKRLASQHGWKSIIVVDVHVPHLARPNDRQAMLRRQALHGRRAPGNLVVDVGLPVPLPDSRLHKGVPADELLAAIGSLGHGRPNA